MRGPNNKGCAKIGVVVYSKRNYKELGWGKYDISFDYKVSLDDNSISDFHILEDAHIKAKMHHDKMVEQAKEEITDLALDTAKKMMTDQDIYSQFVQACNQGDLDE